MAAAPADLAREDSEEPLARPYLEAIADALPAVIAYLDTDERYVYANRFYIERYGRRSDLVGRTVRQVVGEDAYAHLAPHLARARGGEDATFETEVKRPGSTSLWVSATYLPDFGPGGRVRGIIAFSEDITDRRRAEERLAQSMSELQATNDKNARLLDEAREARESAERANRVKDEFLAMLGHELRNPLAPIVTALQLMNTRQSDAFARERRIIERQVRHLGRLLDDLLDVSRIAAGRVTLDALPVKVADVVVRAVEVARPFIEERRHDLHVEIDGSLAVRADPTRLAQVVANLLNNAAKYTPPNGRFSIAGRREGGDAVLRVRDDGIGIAPDLLPRVFDVFEQGAQTPDRPLGGLGLGLAIVKNLVALHGGSVEARSDGEGRGAEFVVRLPVCEGVVETGELRASGGCPSGASADSELALAHVLVVDDNEDAAETVSAVLSILGYAVSTARDGASALAAASRQPPEVAVLDLGLPGMDGYELSRRLRIVAPGVHLVALSGYGQDTDRARTRALGFAEHLVKPVDAGTLERLLARLVGVR